MKRELATTTPDEFVEIETGYDKGGVTLGTMMGYADGTEKRGYWLYVRGIKLVHYDGGFTSKQFCLGDGLKAFLLEVKRQGPKAAAQAEVLAAQKVPELLAAYLRKKGLALATKETTPSDPIFGAAAAQFRDRKSVV